MDRLAYGVFGTLLAVKIALLVAFGPVFTPDSGTYVGMAEAMRAGSGWLRDAGLDSGYAPGFAMRIIGYPAIIAAAMTVASSAWPYLLVGVQSVLSLIAAAALLRLGDELGLSRGLSLVAASFAALSLQLTLDQCILTDSFNASFLVLAIVLIASGCSTGRPLALSRALAAGLLIAAAFLLREIIQIAVVVFVPLFAVRVAAAKKGTRVQTCAAAAVALLPLFAAVEGYKQWSEFRTGERFVTTGAQTVLLHAVALAARNTPELLDADTTLDRTMRDNLHGYSYGEVVRINMALFAGGFHAPDIARLATGRYIEAWRNHPRAMLAVPRANISENQAKLAFRPVTAVCEIIAWGHSVPECDDYRDVYRKLARAPATMTAGELATFVIVTMQNTVSIAVFAAFLIGVPVLLAARLGPAWIRRERPAGVNRLLLLGALWALYCGWDLAYCLLTLEDRYLMPVVPLSVFAGFFVLREMARLRWSPTPLRDRAAS